MRSVVLAAVTVLMAACNRGDEPPEILTDSLQNAEVGAVYSQWLESVGGEAPLRWSVTQGGLPDGMVFNPAGAISGATNLPGEYSFTVEVLDAQDRRASAELDLTVLYSADSLPCGETISGRLEGSAITDRYEVDWAAPEGYLWIQIPLPTDDTTRIDLEVSFDSGLALAQLGPPGTTPGDTEASYESQYVQGQQIVTVDLGTNYDLAEYKAVGEPISLLLVAGGPSEWSVTSTCSDGPIFDSLSFFPTLLGEPLNLNYNIIGDNLNVEIWTEAELPEWVNWSRDDGRVSGVASEVGVWEYTVLAEDEQGRTREEFSGFGVYEHVPLACDEELVFRPDEGYYDGVLAYYLDPRGYVVTQTPIPAGVSAVQAELVAPMAKQVGFAAPNSFTFLSGGPSQSTFRSGPISAEISPSSWPPIKAYTQAQDPVYTVAYSYYAPEADLSLTLSCDYSPRPNLVSLPVFEAGGREDWTLPVVGGTPPYTWSADGLPDGVAISADGVLSTDEPLAGATSIELSVTDAQERSSTTPVDLTVGWEAACEGAEILACGERKQGTFTESYYDVGDTPESLRAFCLGERDESITTISAVLTAGSDARMLLRLVAPGHPSQGGGSVVYQIARDELPTTVTMGEDSAPPLNEWSGLPVRMDVRAWFPGDWTLELVCE